jgi:hypothetical protein
MIYLLFNTNFFNIHNRDREFATIIVSNLPFDAKEGELKTIFHEVCN